MLNQIWKIHDMKDIIDNKVWEEFLKKYDEEYFKLLENQHGK